MFRFHKAGEWLPELVAGYDTVQGVNELAVEIFLGPGKG